VYKTKKQIADMQYWDKYW